jgi:hypothetical protein
VRRPAALTRNEARVTARSPGTHQPFELTNADPETFRSLPLVSSRPRPPDAPKRHAPAPSRSSAKPLRRYVPRFEPRSKGDILMLEGGDILMLG